MIKILLSGCNGKMGQVITDLARENDNTQIVAGYDIKSENSYDYPVYTRLENCSDEIDVIIDFSHPAALQSLLDYSFSKGVALVIATTGLSKKQEEDIKKASEKIPVFYSANMSLGINLLVKLVKQAAKALADNFDIEIIEKHHNRKIDAPSGTALYIADSINEVLERKHQYVYDRHSSRKKRSSNEIGLHAVRGGTIAGDHSVIFAGNNEILEINHSAGSRDIFASGALNAAAFLKGKKPGMYNMSQLITERM